MKTFTKTLTLSLALVAVLGLAGMANAQGHGMGMMSGSDHGNMVGGNGMGMMGGMQGLTPEKQAVVQKVYAEYNAFAAPLSQQLFAKQSELNALLYGGAADSGKIPALTKEIGDLNAKLYNAQVNLRKQLVKEGVPASGMGMGGMHMGAMGGNGHGNMMGGMGMNAMHAGGMNSGGTHMSGW